jgi:hypothetical protein
VPATEFRRAVRSVIVAVPRFVRSRCLHLALLGQSGRRSRSSEFRGETDVPRSRKELPKETLGTDFGPWTGSAPHKNLTIPTAHTAPKQQEAPELRGRLQQLVTQHRAAGSRRWAITTARGRKRSLRPQAHLAARNAVSALRQPDSQDTIS